MDIGGKRRRMAVPGAELKETDVSFFADSPQNDTPARGINDPPSSRCRSGSLAGRRIASIALHWRRYPRDVIFPLCENLHSSCFLPRGRQPITNAGDQPSDVTDYKRATRFSLRAIQAPFPDFTVTVGNGSLRLLSPCGHRLSMSQPTTWSGGVYHADRGRHSHLLVSSPAAGMFQ
ncbi:hypothetical protein SKAU_G00240080 [Synaphobranchus kaupii]|uniref:Uncharacterized protein n=1 Tax=Synaphobranchus kaupii TaxID=118154 RepID=A0A9Q1F7B3_SYNKA|nr:hypothetical protein SKAU_G00240080 [Synaphobranchus kaupii]